MNIFCRLFLSMRNVLKEVAKYTIACSMMITKSSDPNKNTELGMSPM